MTGTLRVAPEKLIATASSFASCASRVQGLTDNMMNTVGSLNGGWKSTSADIYFSKFRSLSQDMQKMHRLIVEHSNDLKQMAENYKNSENKNISSFGALPSNFFSDGGSSAGATTGPATGGGTTPSPNRGSGAVIQGSVSCGVTLADGTQVGSHASGNLFGYSYEKEKQFGIKWEEDEKTGEMKLDSVGIGYGAKGEVHVAGGEVGGNIGLLSSTIGGTVGQISGSGSVGASLWKDGKFSPQLGVEGSLEASGVTGTANLTFGSENNNGHVDLEGTVGDAEFKAGVGAGKITYKDAKGDVKTAYGVKGEFGAEAYALTGKASGGITIFGIDIDIGVSGKLGGGGVSGGGAITKGGVKGSLDVGLVAGLGLEFSIDWTDFKFGW